VPEFPFDAALSAGAVADLYGLDIDEQERGMSIADLFADRLDGAPQEGDRLDFGDAILVAHDVTDDRVRLAGLLLEATPEHGEAPPAKGLAALRDRMRRLIAPA
jgi:cell volume regulation protein A